MKILGQYNSEGFYCKFHVPLKVVERNNTLQNDKRRVVAVRNEYGDWASPSLVRLGTKSRFKIDFFK